jgi:hypothetical protein
MRVLILMGMLFKGNVAMRDVLTHYDLRKDVRLFILSDNSPADKLPLKWCKDVGAPFKVFRVGAWMRSERNTWTFAVTSRDVAQFEIGQPDLVLAFRGPECRTGVRYERVKEIAKKRGVPVREMVSSVKYRKDLTDAG